MNVIKNCEDTKDAVELFSPQGLYLKPIARLNISVQLPQMKFSGKTISNTELMDKLKSMVFPEEFVTLKVLKSTLEFIRFEGEIENKSCLPNVISRLDTKTLKLANFNELLKVRAAEAKIVFPTRHNWDAYFRDAKNMNETKPGERPDTLYISNLPYKWFTTKKDIVKGIIRPSEYVLQKVFEVFGEVRCIDIPAADSYRNKMKSHSSGINTFSFGQERTFDAYIQYKEYICFVKAMDSLRGMKLLYKEGDRAYTANIKVDFDRTKHLSAEAIQQRRAEREKLIAGQFIERERTLSQDKQRENNYDRLKKSKKHAKRKKLDKAKRKLSRKKATGAKLKHKAEKRKLLITQRKIESLRLLKVLFERIKMRREREEKQQQKLLQLQKVKEEHRKEHKRKKSKMRRKHSKDKQRSQEERSEKIERELRERLIKKYKLLQKLHMKEEKVESAAPTCGEQNDTQCNIPSNSKRRLRDSSPHSSNSDSSVYRRKTYKKKHKRQKQKSRPWHDKFYRRTGYHPYFKSVGNYIYTGCNNYFYHSPTFHCGSSGHPSHDFFGPHCNQDEHNRQFCHQQQHTSQYDNVTNDYYRYFKKVSKVEQNSDENSNETSIPSIPHSRHQSRKRKRSKSREKCPCVVESSTNSNCNKKISPVSSNLAPILTKKDKTRVKKSQSHYKKCKKESRKK